MKHSARTVIMTGASAGLGRAIAHRFAREGDRVGLIARDRAALKDVQRALHALGAKAVECGWNSHRRRTSALEVLSLGVGARALAAHRAAPSP